MAYTTPHHAREWFSAAALRVCHEYTLLSQYRQNQNVKSLLEDSKEIDLHWKLAAFFGNSVNIAANGTDEIDVYVRSPRLDAEVKYLVPGRSQHAGVLKDWNWLLGLKNVNEDFTTSAWVVFLPNAGLYEFTECHSVTKPTGTDYAWNDVAMFLPFAEPFMPPAGTMQKLKWRKPIPRLSVMRMQGGKKVRADIVGDPQDAVWAVIYTRVARDEYRSGNWPVDIHIASKTISEGPVNADD
jgi:hypothetical protein